MAFTLFRPVVTEENEKFIYDHYIKLENNYLMRTSTNKSDDDIFDYIDDLEDVIGDDLFAAFLNNDAEIQVADDIYKYTDVGLFISKEDKFNILQEMLEIKNISKDLSIETTELAKQAIFNEYPNDGLSFINGDVSYFKMLPDNNGDDNGGYGNYTPTPGSPASTDPNYYAFLNNLGSCTPHSGLFGNLFGDNYVCIDKYENRRRVKTKAYNYNYLLVYHCGVKVVHQYKGWTGIWRGENTDEIRLVVEAAQFEYNLDKLLGNSAINNMIRDRTYFYNSQKIYFQANNYNYGWNPPVFTYVNNTSLPSIFQDDLTIEFFGTGWYWLDTQIQNGIDSNTKATQFNQWFYNGLYSSVTSQLQTAFATPPINTPFTTPANRTFAAKFPENGHLFIQKSVLKKAFNVNDQQRTFDWGAEISINASQGANSWSISGGAGSVLTRPENFRVKIIGAARRGSSWHGSKFNVGIN